jgi:alpha-tubulin suppressor-like RCC1 family protein
MVPFTTSAQHPPGTVSAWGGDGSGQLGNGITRYYSGTPVQVSGLTDVTAVAMGTYHGLTLKKDGTVWA